MSTCANSTCFKLVEQFGDTLLGSELENNMKVFFDWAFLCIGAWTNVNITTPGAYGGDFSNLRVVDDPIYSEGQVWETARKDWVYETGVDYTGGTPIQISGVWVNGNLYGTGDATYGHHYNYPLGRVVFNTAVDTSDTVQLEYSYRNVQTYRADTAPWWDEIQYRSFRVDDLHFDLQSSGDWSILSNHRVQLPAVVLEIVPRRRFRPYELGNQAMVVEQDILFHVLGESRWSRNQLMDIISFQNDKTMWLFNSDLLATDEKFPLNFSGSYIPNSMMYPDFVEPPYRWKKCTFTDTVVSDVQSSSTSLHEATVRSTLEVIWGAI